MKISIVTVAYNAEATIAAAAASVISQRQDGFELEYIIVDGASTDGTLAALEPYRDGIARVISEPDRGLYDAMNKGVAAATGDFIGILNADDAYAHDRVLAAVAARLAATGADALYGDLDYVAGDGSGRVVRRWRSGEMGPRSFLRGWMPPHPTFFLARSVYAEHGVYSLDLRSAADYELMLRMLYDPRLTTGMDVATADPIARKIALELLPPPPPPLGAIEPTSPEPAEDQPSVPIATSEGPESESPLIVDLPGQTLPTPIEQAQN